MKTNRWTALTLGALLLGGLAGTAQAQYFGTNKVKYRDFDFRVLETPHFKVYYYVSERASAELASRMAERWYQRLAALFGEELKGKQPLILYASHPEFTQTTAISGELDEGTGGVTEPLKRRIVLPMAGSLAETDHVLGHELVHAFQFQLAGIQPGRPLTGSPAISDLPLWVIEGQAEYFSLGPRSALTATWLRDGVLHKRLPSLNDLGNEGEYFPYRWGQAFWAYVGGRYGPRAVWDILQRAARRRGGSLNAAMDSVLHQRPDSVVAQWHRAVEAEYAPLRQRTDLASDEAKLLTGNRRNGLDLAPAISPDGKRFLYLSSRDPYSIDLYLADAESGAIQRRLTQSALDPHYQSLEFVNSAGAWASDNERVAFTALSNGTPQLVIMRASTGERLKSIDLPQFGELLNPAWSPDGQRIAFVANQGGFLDLWIVDLANGGLRRLTRDSWAELQPSWSPDGSRIAVATDRFGPGFGLALVDPADGAMTPLRTFAGAKNLNPHWSPDGASLYFVSDYAGIPNLYRLTQMGDAGAEAPPEQLTNLFTGVTGLTELSPAFDVAATTGRILFTGFGNSGHHIYRLDQPHEIAHAGVAAGLDLALLPPEQHADLELSQWPRGAAELAAAPATRHDYRPGLTLDYVAPPSLALQVGGTGTFVGGGTSLYFSDMLGIHELETDLQFQIVGGHVLNGIAADFTYLNSSRRGQWGFTVGQVPQLIEGINQGFADVNGDGNPELVDQTFRFWTVSRHLFGLFQYPLSRSDRIELSAGVDRESFDADVVEQAFNTVTGQQVDQRTVSAVPCGDSLNVQLNFCRPAPLNLLRGSLAYVHDRTIPGYTGPVQGIRARFQVSPNVGSLDYLTLLGDWRGYARVARPVTLAARLMHYGRYLKGAEDQRLVQLFLGYPELIRGYDIGSFDLGRCPTGQAIASCSELSVYNQLFGSRLALANAEARLSLFGPTGVLGRGVLPTDLFGFFDAGLAWSNDNPATPADERAFFLGGGRHPLTSAGGGVRFNLFGIMMADIYWVRPFDRPLRGGYINFALNAGF